MTGVVALMKALDDGLDVKRIEKILVETGEALPGDELNLEKSLYGDAIRKLRRNMGPLVNARAALEAVRELSGGKDDAENPPPAPPSIRPVEPPPEAVVPARPWPPRGGVDEVWADPVYRAMLRELHPRWIREMEEGMRRVRGRSYSTDAYCRTMGPGIEIVRPPMGRGWRDPVEWCWRHWSQWHRWIQKQPRPR